MFLDKDAAIEHMLRPSWRIGVTDFTRGITDTRDWHVETRGEALDQALALFEGLHPELTRLGYTHGITMAAPIRREVSP